MSNPENWNKAQKFFEEKKYLESFYETLNYIDESLIKTYGNATKTEFHFPQGSAIVILRLEENKVHISAPFVKIPATKFMPIFRKCTELNFQVMTLPQIVIRDNYLVFQYSMPLTTCEPYKLYSVLRDIAQNADRYDDEFVEKYGAERVMEPMVTHYPIGKMNEILETWKSMAREGMEQIHYYEQKRKLSNACDALYVTLKRLDYYCEPSGTLYRKIEECEQKMFDRNEDMVSKLKYGKQFLTQVENLTAEEMKESVFQYYAVMSLKRNAGRNYLEEWIESYLEDVNEHLSKDNFINAGYLSLFTLYTMLANFNLEENSLKSIEKGLKAAADKPWNVAAPILAEVLDFFYQNQEEVLALENDDDEPVDSPSGNADDYMKQLGGFMSSYQSVLGNIMSVFKKK